MLNKRNLSGKHRSTKRFNSARRSFVRCGAAAIETAVALPLVVMLVFSSIEAANAVFLKQAASIAAYEGARSAARPGGTSTEATTRINEILDARSLTGHEVTIIPAITTNTPRGTEIIVRVSLPTTGNLSNPLSLLKNESMQKEVRMVRL